MATNFDNFYFLSNSILNFRKSFQIWGKLAQEQKLQAKTNLEVENTLSLPSAHRVKFQDVLGGGLLEGELITFFKF